MKADGGEGGRAIEEGAEETCGQADGGVRDLRRTEEIRMADSGVEAEAPVGRHTIDEAESGTTPVFRAGSSAPA